MLSGVIISSLSMIPVQLYKKGNYEFEKPATTLFRNLIYNYKKYEHFKYSKRSFNIC